MGKRMMAMAANTSEMVVVIGWLLFVLGLPTAWQAPSGPGAVPRDQDWS